MEATFRIMREYSAAMAALSASDQESLNAVISQGTQAIQIDAKPLRPTVF